MTDWMWCYENPKEAAAEIDRLLAIADRIEAAEATIAAFRKKYAQLESIEGFMEPPAMKVQP